MVASATRPPMVRAGDMAEMMAAPQALAELAAVLADPDFTTDPGGLLRSWASAVAGELDESARYAPCDDGGGHEPPLGDVESLAVALAAWHGRVRNGDVRRRLPDVSAETVRLRLAGLCSRGILTRKGRNSGTTYTLRR